MCLSVDVCGIDGEGTDIAVFLHLMQGEFDDRLRWPFRGMVTVMLLDQRSDDDRNKSHRPRHHHERSLIEFDMQVPSVCVSKVEGKAKLFCEGQFRWGPILSCGERGKMIRTLRRAAYSSNAGRSFVQLASTDWRRGCATACRGYLTTATGTTTTSVFLSFSLSLLLPFFLSLFLSLFLSFFLSLFLSSFLLSCSSLSFFLSFFLFSFFLSFFPQS